MNALPALLEEVAEQAKYYDVTERALIGGRRRRRHRLAMSSAAVATSLAVVIGAMTWPSDGRDHHPLAADPTPVASPVLAVPSRCLSERLPLPGIYAGSTSTVQSGDPTGRYLAGKATPLGPYNDRLVIWDRGTNPRLVPTQGSASVLHGVNSYGVAVGTSVVNGYPVAWKVITEVLVRLAGQNAAAYGINEDGDIVGQVDGRPAIWRSSAEEPEPLSVPNGVWTGAARGIRDDGTIIGYLRDKANKDHAFVWHPDRRRSELTPPTSYESASALSIAGDWVVGTSGKSSVRWNLRTGEADIVPGALTINRHGWTGGTDTALTADAATRISLVTRIAGLPNAKSPTVTAISDEGVVLGGDLSEPRIGTIAVRWRCS